MQYNAMQQYGTRIILKFQVNYTVTGINVLMTEVSHIISKPCDLQAYRYNCIHEVELV